MSKETAFTLALTLTVTVMLLIRVILPVTLTLVGAFRKSRHQKGGLALLIAGLVWAGASLALWIAEGILYGF